MIKVVVNVHLLGLLIILFTDSVGEISVNNVRFHLSSGSSYVNVHLLGLHIEFSRYSRE